MNRLRGEPFLRDDLIDPPLCERADAGLAADLVVVRRDAIAKLDLECRDGCRAGGVGGFDIAGLAVVIAKSGAGTEPVGVEFSVLILPQVPMGRSGRAMVHRPGSVWASITTAREPEAALHAPAPDPTPSP